MKRSPFPIPFGWFQIGWPDDVAPGEVKPLEYFDRHLVLWRDEDGHAHLNDAFCPHLGAHLGHGGKVYGCEIACPFHGWRFDAEGANTLIPYSNRTNKREHIRVYPVLEQNGITMAWYHPFGEEPMWDLPLVPEFNEPGYTPMVTRDYEIEAPWQELAENGVDSAHFRYVHHTEEVPELEGYEMDGHIARMRSSQKFPTPRGVIDGRIDVDNHGPGFSVVRFSGIVDTILMGCNTPVSVDRCEMRFNFTVKKLSDDDALNSTVGDAFVNEIHKQVQEDKPIWENKAHLVRPALADNDGPFMKFRKWAAQFYAEPVEDERLVYPPLGSFPATPIETASRRHGTDW